MARVGVDRLGLAPVARGSPGVEQDDLAQALAQARPDRSSSSIVGEPVAGVGLGAAPAADRH